VTSNAGLAAFLTSAWQRRGLLAWVLAPLSLIYTLVLALRRRAYASGLLRSTRLSVPVIAVGNLYVGGTGKTPLTIEVVRALRQRGWVPGVVSRGYGRTGADARMVHGADVVAEVGDEPLLIARSTGAPVAVAGSRVDAARTLLRAHAACDVLVADDALQHLRLARDIEVVVFDDRGFGNGWVLPAGPLREPPRRLRTVDAIVLHRTSMSPVATVPCFAMHTALGQEAYQLGDRAQSISLHDLARRQQAAPMTITAAAGIGVPQRFFDMLRAAGLDIQPLPLPDHYDYRESPFAADRADLVLITEKDAVKCERIDAVRSDTRIWVVPLVATIDSAFVDFLVARLSQRQKNPHGPSVA
jgi:tetraacyldisaccharide 4'-kinase